MKVSKGEEKGLFMVEYQPKNLEVMIVGYWPFLQLL